MAITSAPAVAPATIEAFQAVVFLENAVGGSSIYSGIRKLWLNAFVERLELNLGPVPSKAIIIMPISEATEAVGVTATAKVHSARYAFQGITRLGAPNFASSKNFLYTRIFVFENFKDQGEEDIGDTDPIFVGYIIDYQWSASGQDSTTMRVVCEDARHFAKKAPVQGTIFHNPQADEDIYIRAHQPIMNLAQRNNRFFDNSDEVKELLSESLPKFVNLDLNRFRDAPGTDDDREFIDDADVETLTANRQIGLPHARKWLPGHAWNYIVNMHDSRFMKQSVAFIKPGNTELGRAQNVDDVPVDLNPYMEFPLLTKSMGDDDMGRDFFIPRAIAGGIPQTGTTIIVSGLGEFNPHGIPMIDALFEICRRVGNYTLAPSYTQDGKLRIEPIRTVPAPNESRAVPVGLRTRPGGSGGGKQEYFVFPSTNGAFRNNRPEVHSWNIRHGAANYYNRFFMHGGKRWIQITLSTVGKTTHSDHLGRSHTAYTPAAEWNPLVNTGTLQPGWALLDEDEWLKVFDAKTDLELFPDVFRTWIVPDDIDWVAVWNQAATAQGYRMFFERDRQTMNELITATFEKTLGAFRKRKQRLPIFIWRAYQGIPINAAGDKEKYGGSVGDAISGKSRWFRLTTQARVLTDGRLGFHLDSGARRAEAQVVFEDPDATTGKSQSPWSWNGESTKPFAYEMFWTIAVEADEDLYEFIPQSTLTDAPIAIKFFGPHMEMHRTAGNEYGEERVANSMVDFHIAGGVRKEVPRITTGKPAIYRDDQGELTARTHINVNRHMNADIEGDIQLDNLNLDLVPGQYIHRFRIEGERNINFRALISNVIHDFVRQQTTVQIATVR